MSGEPVVLSVKVVAKSDFFAVEQVHLRFPSGEERIYERLREWNSPSVIIVALCSPNTLLMVREYACGVEQETLTLPKGMMELGETASQAADRELKEEVGFGARRIYELGELTLAPGHLCHKITVLLAEDLYECRLSGDEPEQLEVVPVQLSALGELIGSGKLNEARSIAAICIARNFLESRVGMARCYSSAPEQKFIGSSR